MSKALKKTRKGAEPVAPTSDITEGVQVQYPSRSVEAPSNLDGTDVEVAEAGNDAGSAGPQALVIPEIETFTSDDIYAENIGAGNASIAKEGSMPESPWQGPPKPQRTLTPRNLVQIMEHELRQKATNQPANSPIVTVPPGKVLLIKERLQARLPQMGISGVRNKASNPKVNAEPVEIIHQIETPHREDKEDWYTKTNEAQRIVFERFPPVKIRTQQQAEPKAWQLQIGMPTLAQMEMEIEYSKVVPPSYG